MESSEPSEEVDAFTREYTKILQQLPSMLQSEPMPKHLENYIKSTKKDRAGHRQQQRTLCYTDDGHGAIACNDDGAHDEYPPLITDSYFNLSSISCHDHDNDTHKSRSHKHRHKRRHHRSTTSSSSSNTSSSSRAHAHTNKTNKHAIRSGTHFIYDDHACRTRTDDDDALTIQKLQRINEMLSQRDVPAPPPLASTLACNPTTTTTPTTQDVCVQTDSTAAAAAPVAVDTLHRHTQTYISAQPKAVQTDAIVMMDNDSKIAQMITKLSDELSDKSEKYAQLQHDYSELDVQLKHKHATIQQLTTNVSGHKQQIEDHAIYCNNLLKHLDEKSRNEALLRREIHEHQKQLESAHVKLQHQSSIHGHGHGGSGTGKETGEIKELRKHLMLSEQKCLDWKKKWKQQCYRLEQNESEKVMTQHRIDQQLVEYQRIIQDFRDMMKQNLDSVNENFQRLQTENSTLKHENEKLLFELGSIQESAFGGGGGGGGDTAASELKQNLSDKNSQIQALTKQLTQFQNNVERTHLKGTQDKAVQCIVFVDGGSDVGGGELVHDNGHNNKPNELINTEFNELSIEIFKLSMNLHSKSNDVMNEYGFGSLNNSPDKKGKDTENVFSPHASLFDVDRMDDTDDIDKTSMVVNCKKRFYETKQVLKRLLKCFDEVMYEQATQQADHCITQ